ncbi:MAG: hypothetical protein OEY57_06640 [Nitrospirota bacterium]|nr:hypothetical protein [Nitrospirota bacterium]
MELKNKVKGSLYILGSLFTVNILGCAPAIPLHSGQFFDTEQIANIQRGKSTKDNILSSLGAPIAIAAKDEIITIQSPTIWHKGKVVRGKYHKIDSDTFFELFSGNHALNEHHRIYYYYSAWSKMYGWYFLFGVYEVGRTDIDELWFLINEQTDVVEDYFVKLAS